MFVCVLFCFIVKDYILETYFFFSSIFGSPVKFKKTHFLRKDSLFKIKTQLGFEICVSRRRFCSILWPLALNLSTATSTMMRSPCRGGRQKRIYSPVKVYESPSIRPSSLKRGKRSKRTLKSRNGRSLTAQFTKCRKSERPTVSLQLLALSLFYIFWLTVRRQKCTWSSSKCRICCSPNNKKMSKCRNRCMVCLLACICLVALYII